MKKSLVALAVAGVAGAASAQSSVTLYGIVDTGYSNYSNDTAGGRVRLQGLSSSNTITSRLGFRGVEDLGGGLKAKFNLEAGINTDDGAGQITTNTNNTTAGGVAAGGLVFARLAYLGLEGKFGEVRIGRDIHPGYYNYVVFDPFGAVGAAASLPSVQMFDGFISTGAHIRLSNSVSYFLPGGLGGLYGQVMYAPSEIASNAVAGSPNTPAKKDGQGASARLGFRSGPFDIALAYVKVDATVTAAGPTFGRSNDRESTNLAGSYDFGVVKLFGQYGEVKVDNYRNIADNRNRSYMIGATAPFGPHVFKISFAQSESSGQNSEETDKFGIGYEYRFSKRTAFYAQYGQAKNKNGGRIGVGAVSTSAGAVVNSQFASGFPNPPAVVPGGDSRGVDIGLRHAF